MLTVRSAERDKVAALDAGADDYVVKPFGIEELLARIRAALRRYSPGDGPPPFASKDLSIDFEARQVTVRDRSVHLTPKEYEDRKSTRLNSSHGYISYAVFCLKKKKPRQEQTHSRQQT